MRGKTQAVGELLEPRQGRVRARSKALDVSNLDLHSDQKVSKNRSGVSFNRGHEIANCHWFRLHDKHGSQRRLRLDDIVARELSTLGKLCDNIIEE